MIHEAGQHRGDAAPLRGPSLRAVPFLRAMGTEPIELLSDVQRQQLARHATVHVLPARKVVYRAGTAAESVFIVGDGVVKSFRDLPSGRRRITAFLFARDLFGLAASGHYVNTVQAITPIRIHEINVAALTQLFKHDAELELQFLCKAVHVLREAQHHNILIGRRDAAGRVAMFLRLLQKESVETGDVAIPMTRSDMANYLGLSLEAVVRASRRLERQGIVAFVDRHHARIVDDRRFQALAASI